jgi:gas vesicle protein
MKAFFFGLGIGVALGVLFAPMSGEETRSSLRERAEDLGDNARQLAEQAREQARQKYEQGAEKAKQAYEQGIDKARQGAERVRAGVQSIRGQANESVETPQSPSTQQTGTGNA